MSESNNTDASYGQMMASNQSQSRETQTAETERSRTESEGARPRLDRARDQTDTAERATLAHSAPGRAMGQPENALQQTAERLPADRSARVERLERDAKVVKVAATVAGPAAGLVAAGGLAVAAKAAQMHDAREQARGNYSSAQRASQARLDQNRTSTDASSRALAATL